MGPSHNQKPPFWKLQTPSHDDLTAKRMRRYPNGIASLNRSFGSRDLGTNRLAISNLRNIFDYPRASTSTSSPLNNHFDTPASWWFTKSNITPGERYVFGVPHNSAYNTVHPHHPIQRSKIFDTDTAEVYEDLDYYERLPTGTPPLSDNKDNSKLYTRQNTLNSSPHYHTSSTTTSACTANDTSERNTNSDFDTPPTPPPFPPSGTIPSSFTMKKTNILITDSITNKKDTSKKKKTHSFTINGKRFCLILLLLLAIAVLIALASIVAAYIIYASSNSDSVSLDNFLRDSTMFFQQNKSLSSLSDWWIKLNKDIHSDWLSTQPPEYDSSVVFSDEFNSIGEERSRFSNMESPDSAIIKVHSQSMINIDESSQMPSDDTIIEPKHLLTLQITQRKICLFEVSTSEQEQSRRDFRSEHIPGARLLFYSSLSHNGVPVHPLQFQRYARSLGIDNDCRVILYDRGQQIWASYAFWIFQLYGHTKISLLNGGFEEWRRANQFNHNSTSVVNEQIYHIVRGVSTYSDRTGNFRAYWNTELISTFDDVLATFEARSGGVTDTNPEIIDAQTMEEYSGKARELIETRDNNVIFGHIRGAINIPIERLYDVTTNRWNTDKQILALIRDENALTDLQRPLIVYDGTSLRASMVWLALKRHGYAHVSIYFGSWPEWIIRAPDYLKVIPT